MKLFVVHMLRWGDNENHSYVEGVYDTLQEAVKNGDAERLWRDNKYEPDIRSFDLNTSYTKLRGRCEVR